MITLTGQEASILAFIAQCPESKEIDKLKKQLDSNALEVAECILNKDRKSSDSHRKIANAILAWAGRL